MNIGPGFSASFICEKCNSEVEGLIMDFGHNWTGCEKCHNQMIRRKAAVITAAVMLFVGPLLWLLVHA